MNKFSWIQPDMLPVFQDGDLDMFQDNDKNNKYFFAIKSAIATRHKNNQKAIVLDIGTTCGLLSMMASKAGADEIYTCEELWFMFVSAKKVIARNNFSNIKLINKNSKDLTVGVHGDIPKKANILMTEIFGNYFLAEGAIQTINHANKYLLTEDCIRIPQKAVMFAQVVDCKLFANMNIIGNILLPNKTKVKFPHSMKTCSNKTNVPLDMQLGALSKDKFSKLSNSMAVFEFCWNEEVPEFNTNSIEFISCRPGTANTIFSWWDLHLDSTEQNIISVKPTWAGGSSDNWRYGWMPRAYFGHCTLDLDLQEGTNCYLNAFHDESNIWYKVCKASAYSVEDITTKRYSNACDCSIHCLFDLYQIGEANDLAKIERYVSILQEHIVPDETTVLVLSEPDGTILHLLAAGLGAKKVFLIPTHLDAKDYYRSATNMLISRNQFGNRIQLLSSTISNLTVGDFQNCKIDFVVGDPYFGKESCVDRNFLIPFHHLLFWKYLNFLKHDLGVLSEECEISPSKAHIKAMAVKFDFPLARINCRIDTVCDDQFNIQDFTNLFRRPRSQMDYQYLCQYPGVAASEPKQLMDFEFNEKIPRQGAIKRNNGILRLKKPADGFVVWIEWQTGNKTFSTGPSETPIVGQPVIWENYKKQGIYYNNNLFRKLIKWSIVYDCQFDKLVFSAE